MRFSLFWHYASKNGQNLRPCQAVPGPFRGWTNVFGIWITRPTLARHGVTRKPYVCMGTKRGCASAKGSVTQELHHGLGAGMNVQLLIDIGDVAAQRAGADSEVILDLLVKKPLGELLQDICFARGEPLEIG